MRRIRIALWAAAAVLLAVTGLAYVLRPDARNMSFSLPLAAKIGAPFELTTHEGKRMSSAELAGKPFVVFFGYTHCPDVCPTTLLDLSNLIKQLGPEADRARFLFISVDTERDTPEQLKLYLSNFDPRITGLTGTPEEIAAVARAYHAIYRKVASKSGSFTYDHTAEVSLMDKGGRRVGTLNDREPEDVRMKKLRRLISSS
jgi:protein SCO1/2